MKVILHKPEDLELRDFDLPGFDVESHDPQAHFSAMEMFATSMALCTYSVLAAYAEQIETSPEELRIGMRWSYVPEPFRIGNIDMDIHWPGLPESRIKAAQRAASHCTLHHTLEHPPTVVTTVTA